MFIYSNNKTITIKQEDLIPPAMTDMQQHDK